jgi:predicted Abi (CAAX) family protease
LGSVFLRWAPAVSTLVLRANQVGSRNPRIAPVAPFSLGC